ncbi:hypothetical protein FJY94_03175 [Candidatus Kaiserbacteria bacterium]|nr:hypothetical protein [Candidatus Kaiserbacteria bacterium]
MRRKLRFAAAMALTSLLTLAPLVSGAQTAFSRSIVPCSGPDCTLCHLATLAQNILNTGIYVAVVLSAGLFAWAGGMHLTAGGDTGKAKTARTVFTNVAIGLFWILAAWLLVDTIMKTLTPGGGKYGPWNRIC